MTRFPDPVSGACRARPRSPRPRPLAPSAPQTVARPCSPTSPLLWPGLTSHARASPASAHHLPGAGQTLLILAGGEISRFPRKKHRPHARVSDDAEPTGCSRSRTRSCCLPPCRRRRHSGLILFRSSMAGPCAPLPTLRFAPRGAERTARGQCGTLFLHCEGLAPSTPCRSPGAPAAKLPKQVGGFNPGEHYLKTHHPSV